jgi:DNA repair protein RadC
VFERPEQVKNYPQLQLGGRCFEVFAVMFLDSRQRLLELEEMFRGTLTQTSVYPRVAMREL